ncbi:hypothetical protein [Herbidospora sp. NBRC 101105]|uniref:hypothetical protein n=1 Tax=Herbidospora sp. NBRC 101105 TaxID=3032195 RepID=UPI00249FBB47|nr:hypothetical protein [Herbidospora sp. NBRC 101105]GLX93912.1 hypothetical protein Hesp01_18620 [Herbidospora sp. NBRC 101105]
MFIQPWDASLDDAEWQAWIADGHDFGQLAVNGPPGGAPLVVPTHFIADGPDLLTRQLAHFQPGGDHAEVAVGRPPYGRMLSGIRGLRLNVAAVQAKFKYDDHKSVEHRTAVAGHLIDRA